MVNSVTFPEDVGGDGSTYTDDANATTGLARGGHRLRLVKMFAQVVAVANFVRTKASEIATLLLTAMNFAETSATSSTSLSLTDSGDITFELNEADKGFVETMDIALGSRSDTSKRMYGVVKSFNPTTRMMTATMSNKTATAGPFSDWNVFRSTSAGIPTTRAINVSGGLLGGAGTMAADITLTLAKATAAEIAAGTEDGKVMTPKGQKDSFAPQVLTDAATVNWNMGAAQSAMVTITATRTLAKPTGYYRGMVQDLEIWNTGAFDLNFHTCYEFGAQGAPEISQGAGKLTVVTMRCIDADATNPRFRCAANLDS